MKNGSPKPPSLDSGIFRQARSGTPEAINELLESCRTYLTYVASERLDPELRARLGPSDLVQETIIAARKDFERFDGATGAELMAWLRGILINKFREARRHHGAKQRSPHREVRHRSARSSRSGLRHIPDPASLPSQQMAASEEAQRISRALSRLTPDQQMVIRLRNWEDLPFEEIGNRLGRNANAARSLWVRALEKLSAALESENDE